MSAWPDDKVDCDGTRFSLSMPSDYLDHRATYSKEYRERAKCGPEDLPFPCRVAWPMTETNVSHEPQATKDSHG